MHCSIKALEILNKIKEMNDNEALSLLEKELLIAEGSGRMWFLGPDLNG